jgi:gas vesicle protein
MHEDYDYDYVTYGKRSSPGVASILMGFLIGGLIGAAAALLMAPQSGEETRTLIRDKGVELKDKATEKIDETRIRAESAIDNTRAKASEAVRSVAGRTEEIARKASDKADDIAKQANQVEGKY